MHEAGLAQNIIHIAEQAAEKNDLQRIESITLEVGQLSGVVVESLIFAFSVLSRNTILEGAHIEIISPALMLYCQECENEYLGEMEDFRCPVCLGENFEVVQGRELLIKSITGA